MKNYTELLVEDKKQKVKFVETLKIAEGVECDVYIFPDDASKDLAIVRIVKGLMGRGHYRSMFPAKVN